MRRPWLSFPALAILALSAAPLLPTSPRPQITQPHQVMAIQPLAPVHPVTASVRAERVDPTPTPPTSTVAITKPLTGSQTDWMRAAGIPESDWTYVDFIIGHESGWRPNAVNPSSGATGLCQALPGSKMASAGSDYLTNPVTQLRWCHHYALQRYGSWLNAYTFWVRSHWW